jgi:hypothetical protein
MSLSQLFFMVSIVHAIFMGVFGLSFDVVKSYFGVGRFVVFFFKFVSPQRRRTTDKELTFLALNSLSYLLVIFGSALCC